MDAANRLASPAIQNILGEVTCVGNIELDSTRKLHCSCQRNAEAGVRGKLHRSDSIQKSSKSRRSLYPRPDCREREKESKKNE
jgi:hypothetical protein